MFHSPWALVRVIGKAAWASSIVGLHFLEDLLLSEAFLDEALNSALGLDMRPELRLERAEVAQVSGNSSANKNREREVCGCGGA